MKYEECSQCGKAVNKERILNLNVVNYWTGLEVNEPEFLLCYGCWTKIKKQLNEANSGNFEKRDQT